MPRRTNRKWKILAALTTGVACASGLGCIQAVLASIGATFF